MADRVILHVGPRKTGTTYLQEILWNNGAALQEQGFFMPLSSATEQFAAVGSREGWWNMPAAGGSGQRLVDEVAERDGTAIISTEVLSALRPRELATLTEAMAPAAVHVVFGLRDLGRQIPAEWQQWLRGRSTTTYEEWLCALRDDRRHAFWRTQDPRLIVERWSRFVPRDHIAAVVVPSSDQSTADLWHGFAEAIGADPDPFVLPAARRNKSLGVVQSELLREVNVAIGDDFPRPGSYSPVVWEELTRRLLLAAPHARPLVVPEAHRGWVVEREQDLIDGLAKARVRVVGEVKHLISWPDDSDEPVPRMEIEADEIVAEYQRVVVGLLHRIEECKQTARESRKVLRDDNRALRRELADRRPRRVRHRLSSVLGRVRGRLTRRA